MSINKGDVIEVEINDINNMGAGVGRLDGKVVFVKGAVSGELVRGEVIKVAKSFTVARLLSVLRPSPHRTEETFCKAPLACGGCTYRNITYAHELEMKEAYVRAAFMKAGLPHVRVLPVLSTGKIRGYRNKGQYPVGTVKGQIAAGFYAAKTHNIIAFGGCEIQDPAFAPIVEAVCGYANDRGLTAYDENTGKGLLRHIYLRIGEMTGEIMLCLVINGESLPDNKDFSEYITARFPAVSGILLNVNRQNTNVVLGERFITLWGKPYIEDILCGKRFRIAPDSFYQVNRDAAELLYRLAAEKAELKIDGLLLDLYCGAGTIGLSMAERTGRLVGIEIVESAVECARINARVAGVDNADFYCADAGSAEAILNATGGRIPDVVVIDPPRKGSTEELVSCLASLSVPRVVYVSCDPDTLARDCVWFEAHGYSIGEVQPVDLFPRTGHVESVVLLSRKDVYERIKFDVNVEELMENSN